MTLPSRWSAPVAGICHAVEVERDARVCGRPSSRTPARLVAVLLLAGAVCLGLWSDPNGTGERGNATIASAVHHLPSPSMHLDGVVAIAVAAAAAAALFWATDRLSLRCIAVPASKCAIRRRGPPVVVA